MLPHCPVPYCIFSVLFIVTVGHINDDDDDEDDNHKSNQCLEIYSGDIKLCSFNNFQNVTTDKIPRFYRDNRAMRPI